MWNRAVNHVRYNTFVYMLLYPKVLHYSADEVAGVSVRVASEVALLGVA